MRSACPDDLPSTPVGRMAAMRQRLEAMRAGVQIVRPALEKFYESLNDEQKARFNALEPDQAAAQAKAGKAELSQVCSAAVTKTNAAPTARIQQALRLSAEQRVGARQSRRRDRQGRGNPRRQLPDRGDADAARTACGDGRPPQRHAAGARRGAAGADRLLQFAQRRAEGALQPARRPPAGQPLTHGTKYKRKGGRGGRP